MKIWVKFGVFTIYGKPLYKRVSNIFDNSTAVTETNAHNCRPNAGTDRESLR